jgi:hypothetical protein
MLQPTSQEIRDEYIKNNSLKEIKLEELIKNIDWNIILPKK